MWIETEIKGRFTTKSGDEMVSFAAKREDGRTWAAPQWLVSKGLGGAAQPGLAVCIEVVRERVSRVQRRTHQTSGASLAAGGPRATTSSGSPRPQEANRGGAQQASGQVLPYGFVPIAVERAVIDSPVWHDGTCGGDLLSGEILCELEALTPLLAGNARYQAGTADRQRLRSWGYDGAAENKQIAEPLRLPDGRVVIAGTALKGMIRHSLGALTSAPMERVAEHHFTYRPNLGHPGHRARLECRPAIVTAVATDRIDVLVLPAQAAIFVHTNNAARALAGRSGHVTSTLSDAFLDTHPTTHQKRIRFKQGATLALDHYLCTYGGGMDGTGVLARAFPGGRGSVHKEALVPQADVGSGEKRTISLAVVQQYRLTQKVLADDQAGHLSSAHPLTKNLTPSGVRQVQGDIAKATDLRVDQLIYVEIAVQSGRLGEIHSFGHNYQYRWAYSSSIRKRGGEPRACLMAKAEECVPAAMERETDVKPEVLTGARLLFGYVRQDETNPVGKGVFERMAGRIAINHAVSEEIPEFLGEAAKGFCIPLRILGQPKASAWEFYLQQPADQNKPPATYGDHPGDAGGELSGRKFYRHQTSVAQANIEAQGDDVNSDQATLGRFICAPKTRFKFAIRFARLRDWELGALLAVLEPHRVARGGMREQFAHKLGLGRPLGMGSVRITPKRFRIRLEKDVRFFDEDEGERRVESALKSLHVKVASADVDNWLDAHEFIDRGPLGYPLGESRVNGQTVTTIYAWHTNLRREYSKLRREEGAAWSQLHGRIRKATIRRREQHDGGE